jgi:hypothetical protein
MQYLARTGVSCDLNISRNLRTFLALEEKFVLSFRIGTEDRKEDVEDYTIS